MPLGKERSNSRLVQANPDKSVFVFEFFADVRNLHGRHAQTWS
jgi:hypothetical protein